MLDAYRKGQQTQLLAMADSNWGGSLDASHVKGMRSR